MWSDTVNIVAEWSTDYGGWVERFTFGVKIETFGCVMAPPEVRRTVGGGTSQATRPFSVRLWRTTRVARLLGHPMLQQ